MLKVYCNGEINYTLKGVHAKVSVIWNFQAPEGTADTHYSVMRGTKCSLVIRQGEAEGYKPILYIEPNENIDLAAFESQPQRCHRKNISHQNSPESGQKNRRGKLDT